MSTVHLGDLLSALLGFSARQSRDGLLPCDLTFGRLVIFDDIRRGDYRPLDRLVVMPWREWREDGVMPEPRPRAVQAVVDELTGALGFLKCLLLPLAGGVTLHLKTRREVTVVDALEVFGHGVLVVAVHTDLLLRT